jgi:hypothetical protein
MDGEKQLKSFLENDESSVVCGKTSFFCNLEAAVSFVDLCC